VAGDHRSEHKQFKLVPRAKKNTVTGGKRIRGQETVAICGKVMQLKRGENVANVGNVET